MNIHSPKPEFTRRPCAGGEAYLMERLHAFGLIEPDGRGGWRPTECCKAGLATLHNQRARLPQAEPPATAMRPWRPRSLR